MMILYLIHIKIIQKTVRPESIKGRGGFLSWLDKLTMNKKPLFVFE
ncbi:hypothetical protein [Moraxella oblonga]|nr:hypothetical protein [Moraxella oblonga]